MKLYYAPGACSLAPHIVAHEAGLDVQLEKVEFRSDGSKSAGGRDYREINPKGSVPALELDDGEVLTENAVILQYLASLAPRADLGPPADGVSRWRFLELLNFIATELHKGFSPLFKQPTPAAREAIVQALGQRFDLMDRQLADRSYLTGDRFTVADAYAYVILNWTRLHQIDLTPWPSLRAFMERVEARPAVQRARREEGLDAPAP
ncbi:glutathione transferase GstA [Phenylobacterium sp. LjRoot219]|uniref:glutathione transferase GstA n=1 Tax=Phenylobacterium sp. LjRoot219 TaxID=3342283 RepID=UPI003ECC71D0